ncbi:MAG: DUF3417 domain-containing protein [Nitrospirae bacterium]|jgi:glucan phosphorylase|nr:DUF3417 domain-containing protein [Nitrospirota bacterium]
MDDRKDRFPNIPDIIAGLAEVADNLWWSWHPAARMLFKMLDRPAWKESRHNPVKMLRELPREVLESASRVTEKTFYESVKRYAALFLYQHSIGQNNYKEV